MGRVFFILMFIGFSCAAQPSVKGGMEAFIKENTVYPPYSLSNCIQGTVTVGFKLNKAGEVFYSTVKSGIGTDLDDEALRLIRMSSGHWDIPLGTDTAALLLVPVNFKLEGYNCEYKSRAEIQQAIAAYKASEGMSNVIRNFYRNKEKGNYNKEEESRMLALKTELGYTEDFMQQKIKDAMKKLKQKDKQGACEDLLFVKNMGFDLADEWLKKYCN